MSASLDVYNPLGVQIMSKTLALVVELVKLGQVQLSAHGYDELMIDEIQVSDVLESIAEAELIENYPDFSKVPCALVLQRDHEGEPIHIDWGIPKDADLPAVLVTGYRPDATRWSDGFTRRLK